MCQGFYSTVSPCSFINMFSKTSVRNVTSPSLEGPVYISALGFWEKLYLGKMHTHSQSHGDAVFGTGLYIEICQRFSFLSFLFLGVVIKLFPQTPLATCLFTISKSTDKLVEHVACLWQEAVHYAACLSAQQCGPGLKSMLGHGRKKSSLS